MVSVSPEIMTDRATLSLSRLITDQLPGPEIMTDRTNDIMSVSVD